MISCLTAGSKHRQRFLRLQISSSLFYQICSSNSQAYVDPDSVLGGGSGASEEDDFEALFAQLSMFR